MATIYEVHVVQMESENVGTILTEIELVDAAGDLDEWHTDRQMTRREIGAGSGTWMRRANTKQILLLDESGGHVEATLDYPRWPLRQNDEGSVFLRQPIQRGGNRLLKFSVARVL